MFKKKISTPKLSLSQVFEIAQVSNEKQFVRKFLTVNNLKSILQDCGFNICTNDVEIKYDEPLKVGKTTQFPDVLLYTEDQVFYFEVMSQNNNGGWNDDHHQQLILKKQVLELNNDEVYAFAVSFKEFETEYQTLFTKVSNCYGLHLTFDENKEYDISVIGQENKIRTSGKPRRLQDEYCSIWSNLLTNNGLNSKPNHKWTAYCNTDITYNGTENGVQLLFKKIHKKLV